jgi:nucleoside-diphosphate-sugar epimerase
MARILVLGASGGCGVHVVRDAVAAGHTVVAMLRPDALVRLGPPAGAITVADDVLRDGAIAEAARAHRIDTVISCLGLRRRHPRNPWSGLISPPDLVARTARSIVAAGAPRVLQISAAGVADSAPRMNWIMRLLVARSAIGHAYRDLAAAEAIYAASALDWTCVRPVTLTRGRARAVREVDRFTVLGTIARASVARWLLDHLVDPVGAPRTPMIATA